MKNKFAFWATIFIFLLELPLILSVRPITAGEPSWIYALYSAKLAHLQWGQDIIYTFGPLFYITLGNYSILDFSANLFITVLRSCLIFGAWLVIFSSLLSESQDFQKNNWFIFGLGIFIALMSIPNFWFSSATMDLLITAVVIGIVSVLETPDKGLVTYLKLTFSSLLLAMLMLIKVSYSPVSILIVLISSIGFLLKRKNKFFFTFTGTFVLFFVLLWVGSGQKLENLGSFFFTSSQIISGYGEAMYKDITVNIPGNGSGLDLIGRYINWKNFDLGIIYFVSVLIIFAYLSSLLISCIVGKRWQMLYAILLGFPLLLIAFKEAVIRVGLPHYYLSLYKLLFLALYLLFLSSVSKSRTNGAYVIVLVVLTAYYLLVPIKFAYVFDALRISASPARYSGNNPYYFSNIYFFESDIIQGINSREQMQKKYSFKNKLFQRSIDPDIPTDVLPQETSMIYAYNLDWHPLPVFQLYAAYTKALDLLNAKKMLDDPPKQIIYSYNSIDDRYPMFDSPAVMREIMQNYKIQDSDANNYVLFVRKENNVPASEMKIKEIQVKITDSIPVPQYKNLQVYCKIDIQLTPVGKILDLVYKIVPQLQIQLFLENESTPHQFRFLRENAQNGIFISKYVKNQADLVKIINGSSNVSTISNFRIVPNNDTWLAKLLLENHIVYDDEIKITFFIMSSE